MRIEPWMVYVVQGDAENMDKEDYWRLYDEWEEHPASPDWSFRAFLRDKVTSAMEACMVAQEVQTEVVEADTHEHFNFVDHVNRTLGGVGGIAGW